MQTTSLLRSARILRKVLETKETCCHSDQSEKPPANTDVKNSEIIIIIIIIIIIKFNQTNKWYMHNPASVLEKNTHKHRWDFGIQTDPPILARRPDLIIINKKKKIKKKENLENCGLCCTG